MEFDKLLKLVVEKGASDLFITAGGENVAPGKTEAYLRKIPGVEQAVVVGDRQPYLAADSRV